MGRFSTNDKFALMRLSEDRHVELVATGVIRSEAFKVDDVDHYQVEWNIEYKDNFTVICDIKRSKYKYIKIDN